MTDEIYTDGEFKAMMKGERFTFASGKELATKCYKIGYADGLAAGSRVEFVKKVLGNPTLDNGQLSHQLPQDEFERYLIGVSNLIEMRWQHAHTTKQAETERSLFEEIREQYEALKPNLQAEARADERRKCNEAHERLIEQQELIPYYACQKQASEAYAKGKAERIPDDCVLMLKSELEVYCAMAKKEGIAKGQADLIEKLNKKMGSLSLSGGSYGQLDGEETEQTRTISEKDWAAIKAMMKEGK